MRPGADSGSATGTFWQIALIKNLQIYFENNIPLQAHCLQSYPPNGQFVIVFEAGVSWCCVGEEENMLESDTIILLKIQILNPKSLGWAPQFSWYRVMLSLFFWGYSSRTLRIGGVYFERQTQRYMESFTNNLCSWGGCLGADTNVLFIAVTWREGILVFYFHLT